MFINSIQPFKIKIDEVHTLEYKPSNERVYLHDNEGREAVFSRSDAERLYWLNTRLEKIEIKTSKHNQSLTNFILSCINLEVEEVMTEEMQ